MSAWRGSLIKRILLSLFLAGQAQADEWTSKDTAWQATYSLLHVIDWGQTLYISSHPEKHTETNPILGDHPSRERVNTYFLLAGIWHVAVANWLPSNAVMFGMTLNPRRIWQTVSVGVQITHVNINYRAGVKFDF